MKILFALAAGAAGYCYYLGCQHRVKRVSLKEDVNRWEGEGGNVPIVATPSPAPVPRTSHPSGDAQVH